jgi:hypothetical protein
MSGLTTNKPSTEWLIDSGCTNYITYDRCIFKYFNKTSISKVRFGNGEQIVVENVGTKMQAKIFVFDLMKNDYIKEKKRRI